MRRDSHGRTAMFACRMFRVSATPPRRWTNSSWLGWLPAFALGLFLQCVPASPGFLRKYYSTVFVGVGVEVKNLIWTIDEVTTVLGDVRSNRVDITTLIGSAQVSHKVSEAVVPPGLLFFGLPRGVASTKVSEQFRVYILVHLCQLHQSEGDKRQ